MAEGRGIAHVHSFFFFEFPPFFSFFFISHGYEVLLYISIHCYILFFFFFSLLYLSYHSHHVMSAVQSSDLSCLISKRNNARCLIHPHIPIHITITSNLKNNNNRCLNSHCQNLAQEPAATEALTIH